MKVFVSTFLFIIKIAKIITIFSQVFLDGFRKWPKDLIGLMEEIKGQKICKYQRIGKEIAH